MRQRGMEEPCVNPDKRALHRIKISNYICVPFQIAQRFVGDNQYFVKKPLKQAVQALKYPFPPDFEKRLVFSHPGA